MTTLQQIKNKINEYTIQDTYTLEKLNALLDKQIIQKLEYKKDDTTISIIYNKLKGRKPFFIAFNLYYLHAHIKACNFYAKI